MLEAYIDDYDDEASWVDELGELDDFLVGLKHEIDYVNCQIIELKIVKKSSPIHVIYGLGFHHITMGSTCTVRELLDYMGLGIYSLDVYQWDVAAAFAPVNLLEKADLIYSGETIVIIDPLKKYWRIRVIYPSDPAVRYNIKFPDTFSSVEPVESFDTAIRYDAIWIETAWTWTPLIEGSLVIHRCIWNTRTRKNKYFIPPLLHDRITL
jgi:hypothetical protein